MPKPIRLPPPLLGGGMADQAWQTSLLQASSVRVVETWRQMLEALSAIASGEPINRIQIAGSLRVDEPAYMTSAHDGLVIEGVGTAALEIDFGTASIRDVFSMDGCRRLSFSNFQVIEDAVGTTRLFRASSLVQDSAFERLRVDGTSIASGSFQNCYFGNIFDSSGNAEFNLAAELCVFAACINMTLFTSKITKGFNTVLGGYWLSVNMSNTEEDQFYGLDASGFGSFHSSDTVISGGEIKLQDAVYGTLVGRSASGATNVVGN